MVTDDNFVRFGKKRSSVMEIGLKEAKEVLERGLRYFVGDNYQWLPEYDEIVSWLEDNNHKGLLCIGSCGRGKTLICSEIMPIVFKYYLRKNIVKFEGSEINKKYELLKEMDCPVIIDDFGLEDVLNSYGEKHDVFAEFIDSAEKRSGLVILTTNLSIEEIELRYGSRTVDRLRSLTKCVLFEGKSMRA